MREVATTQEKITLIRLRIAVPAIALSYLCLPVLPLLVMLTIVGLNGAAMTAGAPSSGGNALPFVQIPFVTGLICSVVGLLVGPSWRFRLAALIPAVCFLGFIAFIAWMVGHQAK